MGTGKHSYQRSLAIAMVAVLAVGLLMLCPPVDAEGTEPAATPIVITIEYSYDENLHTATVIKGTYTGTKATIPATDTKGNTTYDDTAIGDGAFKDITTLEEVTIGPNVTSIGDDTFNGCRILGTVTIPDGVRSIGDHAFAGCSALTTVNIGKGLTSMGVNPFLGCPAGVVFNIDQSNDRFSTGTKTLLAISGTSSTVVWGTGDDVVIDTGVTAIGPEAFKGLTDLRSVTIGSNVTHVDSSAFEGCAALAKVTIDPSTDVESDSFEGCNITELILGPTTYAIENGDASIKDYDDLDTTTDVIIPDEVSLGSSTYTVKSVMENAFQLQDKISTIKFNETIESVTAAAFGDGFTMKDGEAPIADTQLRGKVVSIDWTDKTVTTLSSMIMDGVTYVLNPDDTMTVTACDKTRTGSVTIPGTYLGHPVESISKNAFYQCTSITSVTIGENVRSIGENAFAFCSSLTSVSIPSSVTSIGDNAFTGCVKAKFTVGSESRHFSTVSEGAILTDVGKTAVVAYPSAEDTVTIPDGIISIGSFALYQCSGVESLEIPASVGEVGLRAFGGCTGLKSLKILGDVDSIGAGAFNGNNLETIVIDAKLGSSSITVWETALGVDFTATDGSDITDISGRQFTVDTATKKAAMSNALTYYITYDLAGGTIATPNASSYTVESAVSLASPTKEGYTFKGWYSGTTKFESIAAGSVGDLALTATWDINRYDVTFDTAGGSSIGKATVEHGSDVTEPEDPVKTGYTFVQWMLGDTAYDFATDVTGDLTLTATWTINSYTLSFDTAGGSEMDPVTYEYGAEVKEPKKSSRSGYKFEGWSPSVPATMPAGDLTLTATWSEVEDDGDDGPSLWLIVAVVVLIAVVGVFAYTKFR